MQWTKPEYQEIALGMEVTAYVNTEEGQPMVKDPKRTEEPAPAAPRETAG